MRDVPPLVGPEWAVGHLTDPTVRFVDVEYDRAAYQAGHLPDAVCWTWADDLVDPLHRDLADAEALAGLLARSGIGPDTHIVLYGDDDWYAAWALWQLRSHGVDRVSLLDGGRSYWRVTDLPYTVSEPVVQPSPAAVGTLVPSLRIGLDELRSRLDELTILDVRLDEEYRGVLTAPEGYSPIAQRAGHIRGATWAPWEAVLGDDGRFRSVEELRALYAALGIDGENEIVTYCGVGVRSAHSWFVLHELLGYDRVRNYDGGWAEWGSVIGVPIEVGRDGAAEQT